MTAKEVQAYELLEGLDAVSAEAMADIFGEGQARHQGMFSLRRKLEAAVKTVEWQKGEGYRMVSA